jgi:hypothetical protein
MPRITELRLPLDHTEEALSAAIHARLGLGDDASAHLGYCAACYDARRKDDIQLGIRST